LFVESNLKDLSAYKDYEVIGVYTGTWNSSNTWVNNGKPKTVPTSFAPQVKIQVPTGIDDGTIEYELKRVVYDEKAAGVSGGVDGICTVEDEFYVIYCASVAAIYKMNLDAMSSAGYEIGKDTIVSLTGNSLDAKFIKFANDSTTGEFKIDTDAKITEIDEQTTNIHSNDGTNDKFTDVDNEIKDNSITMRESDLIAYKNKNPEQKFLAITYSVTFGGVQLQCSINYKLPSLSTVVAYQNSLASEVDITSIYVPVYNGTSTVYQPLKDTTQTPQVDNLPNVTSIVENGSNYTAENGFIKNADEDYTGEIKLNKEAVDNYFDSHATAKFLEIKYTITTRTENKLKTMDFVIVVKKGWWSSCELKRKETEKSVSF